MRATVAAILGTSAISGGAGVALAQEQQPAAVEEVTVTGSRIARKDFEATSPIVTVGAETFENTSTVAIEANLNKLPQFVPAVSQFVTNDVQNTATNTVGASTVSLRGLGPNRNLVLLDGRRAMPVNAGMVVDVNSIPSAAIERVEVTTGGASSVYGADAVGGVVNFILKKNFEGLSLDAQYGATELSDGQEFRISALMGTNFASGRGNVMLGVEHTDRQDAKQVDREFYRKRMADPTVAPTEFFFSDTNYVPGANAPSQGVIDGIFNQRAPGSIPFFSAIYFNKDGSAYTGGNTFGSGEPDGVYRYKGVLDGQFRHVLADGTIGENQQANLASIPLQRWSIFGRGNFEINDNIGVFTQANFNRNRVNTVLQFSPASNGWAATIPYGNGVYAPSLAADGVTTLADYRTGGRFGVACAATGGCTNSQAFPVPADLAALLNSRADPNAGWQLNRVLDFLGPRASEDTSTTYQITAGLDGKFANNDWTWEVFGSHGETSVQIGLQGFSDLERYRAVVTSPNYGKAFFQTGNAQGGGFAGATGACTSGLPIFSDFAVTQDCVDSLSADLQNNTRMKQEIVEADIQGGLFKLPAGELRFALGADYRENTFTYQTDILTSQASFLDGGIGLFPAGNSSGATTVKEGYGELLVPVLAGLPAVKQLNIELGYRWSDYNSVGSVSTHKEILDWVITDSVRFRGGHQVAIRAPNIGELFLNRTQAIVLTSFGDYCSRLSSSPNGANPANNPGAARTEAICRSLMGSGGAAQYYANPQAPGAPGISIANTIGNPQLDPETAKTFTAGFVFKSPFESPLLSKLTGSIDWYSIEISDLIAATTVDTVADLCFGSAFNPSADPSSPACQAIVRDPTTGAPGATSVGYTNQGHVKTTGVDVQVDWSTAVADLGLASVPGNFSINLLVNYLDSFATTATAASPEVEWKGTLGPDSVGFNPGMYDWKMFTTFNYFNGGVGASLRWRHLPKADAVVKASVPTSPVLGVASYDIFDLSGTWQVTDVFGFRFGVDNVFDKQPPVLNRNPTLDLSGGQFDTLPQIYDVLGRRYYLGFKAQF